MPPPPPPPPPMPMMGGPPPPPPPPGGSMPLRPPPSNRVKPPATGALLADIGKGKALKKTVTNDRSAPVVGKVSGGSGPSPLAGAPPVPGMTRPPGGLAPPVPPGGNRARSNSDQSSRDNGGVSGMEAPPQLGGLFAGGMPKLKKRGGGIDTGANRDSSYTSDPESSRVSAPKPPAMAAPKPPMAAPPRPGPNINTSSSSGSGFVPSIANLRKTGGIASQRPMSSASMKGPPPPIGKKPPALPGTRKPSVPTPQSSQFSQAPPPPLSSAPPPPLAPPAPPPSAPRIPISAPSRAQPPPPPTSPPSTNGSSQSLAMQAAIRAAGQASPALAPPPPPPPQIAPSQSSPFSVPSPTSVPPPPISKTQTQHPVRSMLDPSSYTLSPNGGLPKNPSPHRNSEATRHVGHVAVEDLRWRFQDESILPKPREFIGGAKKYRAGRGSSVPLDLSAFH